jgi:hypothetical protein
MHPSHGFSGDLEVRSMQAVQHAAWRSARFALCMIALSYLANGAVVAKYLVQIFGADIKRQVPDIKDAIHFWR